MKHNQNIKSDLEYLAELGYGSFPGSEKDVNDLKQKISARYGSGSASPSFIALIVGLFLGITVFFTIYNTPILFPSHSEVIADNTLKNEVKNLALDTIHVVSPPKPKAIVAEKFMEPAESDSVFVAEPMNTKNISLATSDSVLIADLVYSPNAPIIYLHDLKIANYHMNYFEGKKFVIVHNNVGSDKANRMDPKGLIMEPAYYLHNAIDDAMKSFKKQKYNECIVTLNYISERTKDDVNCDFYRGMCYFYLQNYEAAYTYLKLAQTNKVNVFAEESNYYLALSAIKTKRTEEGKKILNEIMGLNGFYSSKAKEQLAK